MILKNQNFVLTYGLSVFKWIVNLSIDIYDENLEVL